MALVEDAIRDAYDTALIISADSDLRESACDLLEVLSRCGNGKGTAAHEKTKSPQSTPTGHAILLFPMFSPKTVQVLNKFRSQMSSIGIESFSNHLEFKGKRMNWSRSLETSGSRGSHLMNSPVSPCDHG